MSLTECSVRPHPETGKSTEAVGLFTWGLYPNGDHNKNEPLCQACLDDLWAKIANSVAAGTMHFSTTSVSKGTPCR